MITIKAILSNLIISWETDKEIEFLYYCYLAQKSVGLIIDIKDAEVLVANGYDVNVEVEKC